MLLAVLFTTRLSEVHPVRIHPHSLPAVELGMMETITHPFTETEEKR
jgi:hypothetical protein